MNPNYDTPGSSNPVGLKINGVTGIIDYSRLWIAAVAEGSLYEQVGFSPTSDTKGASTESDLQLYSVYIPGKGWIDNVIDGASANLDFNYDTVIQTSQVAADLNNNSSAGDNHPATRSDWHYLVFNGGDIGKENAPQGTPETVECP